MTLTDAVTEKARDIRGRDENIQELETSLNKLGAIIREVQVTYNIREERRATLAFSRINEYEIRVLAMVGNSVGSCNSDLRKHGSNLSRLLQSRYYDNVNPQIWRKHVADPIVEIVAISIDRHHSRLQRLPKPPSEVCLTIRPAKMDARVQRPKQINLYFDFSKTKLSEISKDGDARDPLAAETPKIAIRGKSAKSEPENVTDPVPTVKFLHMSPESDEVNTTTRPFGTDDRGSVRSEEDIVVQHKSFEYDSFTVGVYKRNYRRSLLLGHRKPLTQAPHHTIVLQDTSQQANTATNGQKVASDSILPSTSLKGVEQMTGHHPSRSEQTRIAILSDVGNELQLDSAHVDDGPEYDKGLASSVGLSTSLKKPEPKSASISTMVKVRFTRLFYRSFC